MALPADFQRSFRLYVTHVEGEGRFLKISGQLDHQSSFMVKSLFKVAHENLVKGFGAVPPAAIHEGIICAAKYKGTYYRARIMNSTSHITGLVDVHFIDLGNKDIIPVRNIRFLDSYNPMFLKLPGLAEDYYLSRVMHPSRRWEEPFLIKLQSLLCYAEYPAAIEAQTRTLPIISIQFIGNDLSNYLVSNRCGIALPVTEQEDLLLQMTDNQQGNWSPTLRLLPYNGEPVHGVSQRLMVNKASRNVVKLRAPVLRTTRPPTPVAAIMPPKKSITYNSRLLEVNSQHQVFVSFVEEGPELFAIQLTSDIQKLQHMMDDINKISYTSLTEPPMIGTVCLGRMSDKRKVCRAIVMSPSGSNCKLFFVDFGDTEMVSYYDIFDMPEEFVKPNVLAMRFCLSGVKKLKKSPHLKEAFKELVNGKVLTLRVVPPEGPPLIQYGELLLDNKNMLDLLMANMKDKLQYKWMDMLPLGSRQSVVVSNVDSCMKFYVMLSDKIDELNAVFDAVQAHCENSSSPGALPVGAVCCARFPDDDTWYRAMVRDSRGDKVIVVYVDYGNEREVEVADLRTITPDLIRLPAQALKCALKGFENGPAESKTSMQLEIIVQEKTLMAHVVGMLSKDTMIVSLVDDTDNPPLDVVTKMNQLSQPRSVEPTPPEPVVPKEAQDPYRFPECSSPEEIPKKSFKDERRWLKHGEEFGKRGGRFRGRDNKYSFQDDEKQTNDWGRNFRHDRWGNRGDRRENWGDKKENWNQKREFRDNRAGRNDRGERGYRRNFTPRDRAARLDRSRSSDSDERPERNYRSQDSGKDHYGRAPPYKNRTEFPQIQYKELSDPLPVETPFTEPTVEVGSQHEVSVAWIVSPENFYTQILSLQPKFLEMMHKIPQLYKGVRTFTGNVPVGASILARYPADGVLYRATVVSVQPFSKFIVRYVDYGNKQLVEAKDIWQMERELMDLPKMAVHCSLNGVTSKEGEWKADPEIDLCFNTPRYQCVFQEQVEEQYKVSLWNNGVSVADMLVEKQLATMTESQSSVTLKDEAIDLTIIVGQEILCRVTHVEAFDKFFVQLDLEKANLVESAIANFDVAKLTPIGADSLAEGVHCTVKYNHKIYRAIINDVSDMTKIQAVLPDYGNTITTSIDNLMILPNELRVYYYQSLECRLNNYTEESETLMSLEELKTKLIGNKFIIYVNDVDEIRLVSTLYDVLAGHKIAIFEPDEGALDEVFQLCPRAVFRYHFGNAYIKHVENLNKIYIQKPADEPRLALLLEEMYEFYKEGTPEPINEYEVGTICAAQYADSNWYRATIISSSEDEVKVQFPDFGHCEVVSKRYIKKLDCKFFEPCCFALVAGLGLMALQEDAVEMFRKWTDGKKINVTLAFGSDGWLANLHLDGVDLSVKLIDEKLAAPQVISEDIPEEREPEVTETEDERISLPEGCSQVYISHIDSPGQFWLQMSDKVVKIDEIQAELQTNAESYAGIETREMGTLCVAKYSVDDQWRRAEILDSDSDITKVRFVDYGNTDVLDNQPGLIKAIPEQLKAIERYAVKASVNAIPTGTGQWSEPASDYFTRLVGDVSAPVGALIVLKDVTMYVDIFVNGQNLTDKLVSEGHATRSEESECGNYPSCFASHVKSPSEFWIQLESAAPELQAIKAAMVDAENLPELIANEQGVLCAAQYPEDGVWYRAQVIVAGSEGTEVLFIDYGNASIVSELRSLPEELQIKPALSRKCALQKPPHVKAWSRKSEVKLNELAAKGATIFNVQFVAAGDISIVDLFLEGKSISDELAALCEEHPTSERPTPVGQDLHSSGKICYIHSLQEFYVQLDDSIGNLGKITERLNNAEDFEAIGELKVGSVCTAFSSGDQKWYRAKILELCDVGYHVQFIDYGNKAKCEEFRQLPEDIGVIEPLAKCCRLSNTRGDISNELAKFGLEYLVAMPVTFLIEFLDSLKEPLLVKLWLNAMDVSCILTKDPPIPNVDSVDVAEQNKAQNITDTEEMVTCDDMENVVDEGNMESSQDWNDNVGSNNTLIENKSIGISITPGNEISNTDKASTLSKENIISLPDSCRTSPVEPLKEVSVTTETEPTQSIEDCTSPIIKDSDKSNSSASNL